VGQFPPRRFSLAGRQVLKRGDLLKQPETVPAEKQKITMDRHGKKEKKEPNALSQLAANSRGR
jgi:hypothetical protein